MSEEGNHFEAWTFRLIPEDEVGNLHPENQITVQLGGKAFEGSINDGDKVQIEGKWNEGEVVHPDTIFNLTTRSEVFALNDSRKKNIIIAFVIVVVLLIVGTIGYTQFEQQKEQAEQQFLQHQQQMQQQFQQQTQQMQRQNQPQQTQGSAQQIGPSVTFFAPISNGLTITINGKSQPRTQGASITRTTWDWGDGQSTTGDFPQSHTYSDAGTYTVKVTAYDNLNSYGWSTDSVTVYVPVQNNNNQLNQQQQLQTQQASSSATPYVVVFSGSTPATYANMANYQRIAVIGNNAYWMGVKSDNFIALSNIQLVTAAGDQNTYATQHNLNLVSSYDSAVSSLSNLNDLMQGTDCPVIGNVSFIFPNQQQTITINGRGFGSQQPFVGDSQYLLIADYTANPYWEAGHTGDLVTLNVSKWTDSQIVIDGFEGSYGSQNWMLKSGDTLDIYIVNPNGACQMPGFFDTLVES
ncbi:MAG: PKD domain-containing protein [Thaumarchaeota archaeon]|nr:PKD domain-containing protein [Nitrososphaerota archaeon]